MPRLPGRVRIACGPQLWFAASDGAPRTAGAEEALSAAALILIGGGILAVRGVGGFQLAVDATDERAVALLRERKRREAKPLAVMVRSLEDAARLGRVGAAEAELLASPERPIVLLERLEGGPLAAGVAPGLG